MTISPACSSSAPASPNRSALEAEAAFAAAAEGLVGVGVVDVGGVVIAIATTAADAEAVASYAGDYLPAAPADHGTPRFVAQLRADGELLDRVRRALSATPSRDVTPFREVVYRAHTCGAITWFDVIHDGKEGLEGAYVVGWDGHRAIVVTRPGLERRERLVVRVVRELVMRQHEAQGAVVFHAAGLSRGGLGLLSVGASGAGKTTSLLLSVDRGGTLLSNDRMIVTGVGARWTLVGVPLPVRIGRATLEGLPELAEWVRASHLARPQPAGKDPSQLPRQFASSRKVELTPRELADVVGGAVGTTAPLHAIMLPELQHDDRPPWCEPATVDQVRDVLSSACFTPHDETWLSPWLIERGAPDAVIAERARASCAELARSVPGFRVGLGVRGGSPQRLRELRDLLHGMVELAVARQGPR
jgi:hypothetical protein